MLNGDIWRSVSESNGNLMNTQLPRQSSNGYAMSRNGNAANKIPRQLKITTKKLKMSQAFKTVTS